MATGRPVIGWLVLSLLCSFAFSQTRAPKSVARPRSEARVAREEKQNAPPTQELTKAETIPFTVPSAAAASVWNYCDAEGNVYLQYTTAKPRIGSGQAVIPANPLGQPVTELLLDSQSTTEFGVRSLSGYRSLTPLAFSVDRLGDVYRLYQAQPALLPDRGFLSLQNVVVKFNDDGSVDSVFRLHNPPGSMLEVMHFLAFTDGNLLVTGVLGPAPAGQSGEPGTPYTPTFKIVHHAPAGYGPFTGIFDSSGHLVQQLTLPGDVSPNPPATGHASEAPQSTRSLAASPRNGAKTESQANPGRAPKPTSWVAAVGNSLMAPGPEDTVYLLRASKTPTLYTLSSDGQVIHEARVKGYPAPKAQPINMSAAGQANVMISFHTVTVGKTGNVHYGLIFAVVDPGSGKAIAAYRLPKNSNVLTACAAGSNDFEFIGSTKHGHMEVVKFTGN